MAKLVAKPSKVKLKSSGYILDYDSLSNKPSINNIELSGNKTDSELGLQKTLIAGENITIEEDGTISAESRSMVYSGVVNQNGTITFTNSDGSTFTTTGASVIGSDGFSPTVSTTSEYLRTRVEITDVNGTQYFYINDGESVKSAVIDANGDLIITIKGKPTSGVRPTYPERIYNVGHVVGADGYSPTATVTQTQSGATVSITDKNGTTTANISNGVNGSDYILTAQDKSDIADLVLAELPTTQGVQYGNAGN